MGGKSSRYDSQRYSYSHDGPYGYASSNLGSSSNFGSSSNLSSSSSPYPYARKNFDYDARNSMQLKYGRIGDNYNSLEQVTEALHQAGLESSNLIVGIDFTKSNEWTGARSFHHRSLHHLGDLPNPYEQAISIIGRTLSAFDEDNLIPCYGFGDATTHDQDVFSFYEDRPCNGFEDVLARYREIVPHVHLSGPTSFAPIIETAIGIVDATCGRYHVLVIIADGQVPANGPQERSTIDAIVKASNYPLSIVLVGVGDGPWDMMHQFDDNIPSRAFDNFQFVNFTEIMSKYSQPSMKETVFALNALMEIPLQYKATVDLHLLGNDHSNRYMQSSSSGYGDEFQYALSPYAEQSSHDRSCPVCLWSKKDLALGCGHQTCCDCGSGLTLCPICRTHIITRIKLYD
ncbi:hypothetical protein CIPAW_09G111000 [Carya illinoinensis]|uniref:RING-type domain-containing protein n=1 Tax=Carya illinoinensis TaxID=32201 RepID=A0A8T1PJK1_CARIL|nr:hypothetical protein CIPAW_09G111000 [Carya illinoinensis]